MRTVYKTIQRITGKKTRIGNFVLSVDPENSQPYIIKKFPDHGTALIRIANIVDTKYKNLSIIDVGANFGDTAAMLLTDNGNYNIYCIEGDVEAFKLLSRNFASNKQTHLYKVFLSDKNESLSINFDKNNGSLRLETGHNLNRNNDINFISLDSLIMDNPNVGRSKLLKIDTDGYDFRIMRGSYRFLQQIKPIIFFEYDNVYLDKTGERPTDIFKYLKSLGYSMLAFYDNYGRFLISTKTNEERILKQLDRYITNRKGTCPYYDVAAFHESDAEIADSFVANEENRS